MTAFVYFPARCVPAILLAGALCSCDTLPFRHLFIPRANHVKAAQTHYHADAYVQHLALARLTPEAGTADLNVIDAYATQKPKPEHQTILVLEYKTGNDPAMQQVAAPVFPASRPTGKNTEFSALLEIMNRLDGNAATLHNLHLAAVTVAPDEALSLPDSSSQNIRQALDDQQQRLLGNAEMLPLLDDARAQLQLARFFMDHRFRDAAYISVDNVTRELASASQNTSMDTDAIKNLSHELEALESQLHKILPFTLSPQ